MPQLTHLHFVSQMDYSRGYVIAIVQSIVNYHNYLVDKNFAEKMRFADKIHFDLDSLVEPIEDENLWNEKIMKLLHSALLTIQYQ